MIRKAAVLAAVTIAVAMPVASATAQSGGYPQSGVQYGQRLSLEQLDDLVAPIALYPDPLLAQVLVAATFPDQVDEAAAYVRSNGASGIEDQPWDISVKAVAHYPAALNLMAERSEWTESLGYAYANQSGDVMNAVQRMRAQAAQQGNLVSTPQQQVVAENNTWAIVPAEPRVIYVPVYDPYVVYTRPIFGVGYASRYWSFGIGFPIGSWLTYDCDWRARSVYYNGWNDAYVSYGGGWRLRARPFISIMNVYVSPRYRNVYVNRDVGRRGLGWYDSPDRFSRSRPGSYANRDRDGRREVERRGGDVYRGGGDRNGGTYRGSESRGSDNRGGDTRGYDPRGNASRGGDARGNDTRGGDTRSNGSWNTNDSRGSDRRGTDGRQQNDRGRLDAIYPGGPRPIGVGDQTSAPQRSRDAGSDRGSVGAPAQQPSRGNGGDRGAMYDPSQQPSRGNGADRGTTYDPSQQRGGRNEQVIPEWRRAEPQSRGSRGEARPNVDVIRSAPERQQAPPVLVRPMRTERTGGDVQRAPDSRGGDRGNDRGGRGGRGRGNDGV